MQKNFYQVQQSTVKYRFSFWTLSNRNMKMGCQAIFFLQRLNLVPRGYINLDRTHSFHGILGDLPENLWKLSIYEKCFSTMKLDEKAGILRCERMETIIHFRNNMTAQPSFYHSGMFIKRTPLVQKECPLYRAVHLIEIFLR